LIQAFFTMVSRSFISLAGAVIATASAFLFFALFAIEEFGHGTSAYTGIIAFLILPALFAGGLLLIPLGIWRLRLADRKRAAKGEPPLRAPVLDFNVARTRNLVALVALLTMVNLVILATGTYKGIETMESTEFCGGTCHSVMNPEFTTYKRSPHSRVQCVQCHIGPGAGWFVKSKLSGSWQLIAVAFNLYPRPIATPVENLRPARETCEQCHLPTRFVGERLKVITRFAEDEANTEKKSVLMMKVGGAQISGPQSGGARGIHWHVDPANTVRYRGDKRRQYIGEIELSLADGGLRTYTNSAPAPDAGVNDEWRTMDCVDCHNRPSHIYQRAKDELDKALLVGELDRSLPFLRKEGLRIVQLDYPSWDDAKVGMRKELLDFYGTNYPELAKSDLPRLEATATALFELYKRNVFPSMKIVWGTYPSFRDHVDDSGCFRCHVSDMKSADGTKVSQRCDLCHITLAEDEENPEILEQLSGN
jgi:nitrate/TMAO reductase-like tetraheme cytochrome c subunit